MANIAVIILAALAFVKLTLTQQFPFNHPIDPIKYNVSTGDRLNLDCTSQIGGDSTTHQWNKLDQHGHLRMLVDQDDMKILFNGSLVIDPVMEHQDGRYVCIINHKEGISEVRLYDVVVSTTIQVTGTFSCGQSNVTIIMGVGRVQDFERAVKKNFPKMAECQLIKLTTIKMDLELGRSGTGDMMIGSDKYRILNETLKDLQNHLIEVQRQMNQTAEGVVRRSEFWRVLNDTIPSTYVDVNFYNQRGYQGDPVNFYSIGGCKDVSLIQPYSIQFRHGYCLELFTESGCQGTRYIAQGSCCHDSNTPYIFEYSANTIHNLYHFSYRSGRPCLHAP